MSEITIPEIDFEGIDFEGIDFEGIDFDAMPPIPTVPGGTKTSASQISEEPPTIAIPPIPQVPASAITSLGMISGAPLTLITLSKKEYRRRAYIRWREKKRRIKPLVDHVRSTVAKKRSRNKKGRFV